MTSARAIGSLPRVEVPTAHGPAQVRALLPAAPATDAGTLWLGHGAGGRSDAADVLALTELCDLGWTVLLVDQPWRVAGKKIATRPPTLDAAWADVTSTLAASAWQQEHAIPLPAPWVFGGRSAGARVACRMSVDHQGAARPEVAAVVALAFPLHPPGQPEKSRAHELALPVAAGLPVLVVQGLADPFGSPVEVRAAVPGSSLTVVDVPGAHSPSRDLVAVRTHVADFLATLSTTCG